jgi:SAM-dependent methyltransferase
LSAAAGERIVAAFMAEWWRELFDGRYLEFYEALATPATADEDAAFIERALALAPGSEVLDLGCGQGRHAVALALRGHAVTGLDLSSVLLERARALAASRKVPLRLVERDMRELAGLGPFDACISMHTAFGYFTDEEDAAVLCGIAAVLRPGGRLLLDLDNPFPLLGRMPLRTWRETDRQVTREQMIYDPLGSRRNTDRTLFPRTGGRMEVPSSSVRLYFPHEIPRLLQRAGLGTEGLFGALDDEAYDWSRSPRMVFTAVRRPCDHRGQP